MDAWAPALPFSWRNPFETFHRELERFNNDYFHESFGFDKQELEKLREKAKDKHNFSYSKYTSSKGKLGEDGKLHTITKTVVKDVDGKLHHEKHETIEDGKGHKEVHQLENKHHCLKDNEHKK